MAYTYIDRVMGCLYGGAVGDALGYPVEFLEKEEIIRTYGSAGIQDYALSGGKALMSDDTQMTLFTLGGLLAWRRSRKESESIESWRKSWREYVWKSYQDWLFTQDKEACPDPPRVSWLADEPLMQVQRAPGATCLSALKEGIQGSIEKPVNDSKGCGGLMRVAPAAFWEYDYGCTGPFCPAGGQIASMTHGHPLGIICAIAFERILYELFDESDLRSAIESAIFFINNPLAVFWDWGDPTEFNEIMDKALSLSQSTLTDQEAIEAIGQGWVAEEALAIAVYCCLKHEDDFAAAVTAAVNHGGDSDSTGAVAGNIMGALCGYSRIPRNYLEHLEAKEILDRLALELAKEEGKEKVWERVKRGGWITGYSTKRAIRLNDAFIVEGLDRDLRFEKHFVFEYLLLYQWKKDGGVSCKVRVGPRRFLELFDVVEGTLEVALYVKKKGEGPYYRLETPLVEKKDSLLRFDAEKFLKNCGFDCRPVEKEEYDSYIYKIRYYAYDNIYLSRAYASRGGMFYWISTFLNFSEDSLEFFCVNPQSDGEGKKYYVGRRRRSWDEFDVDDERQQEAEIEVLERIGLEHAAWLEAGKQMMEEEA